MLEQNLIRNVNMLYFLRDYPSSLIRFGDSVMLRGVSDRPWVYFSSRDTLEFKQLLKELTDEDRHFAVLEDWMIPYLLKDRDVEWEFSVLKLYLPDDVLVNNSESALREISPWEASYIYEFSDYQEFLTVDYIADRLDRGISQGVYLDGRLVAWAITQDDGAIGFLHVLPEYRRQGFAESVTRGMVERLREKGMLPFVHIEEGNEGSLKLAQKVGFVPDRKVTWLAIR